MMLFGNINKGLEECRSTPNAVLVDVREADEYISGHISGAINIPLSTIARVDLSKDVPIFLYSDWSGDSLYGAVNSNRKWSSNT